jgi:hypothetical protein
MNEYALKPGDSLLEKIFGWFYEIVTVGSLYSRDRSGQRSFPVEKALDVQVRSTGEVRRRQSLDWLPRRYPNHCLTWTQESCSPRIRS